MGFGGAVFFASKKSGAVADKDFTDDLPLFAAVTLLAAIAAFAGFLWFAALQTRSWYFLPPITLAAVCFDTGLPQAGRSLRAVFYGFIIGTVLVAFPCAQRDLDYRFTNVDLLAKRLALEAAADDFIIVSPWYFGITFDRYFKKTTPWQTLPPLADHTLHRFDLVHMQMRNPEAIQPLLDQIGATLQAGHRVWVVGSLAISAPGTPPPALAPPPPTNRENWSEMPYYLSWSSQIAWFIGNHSLQFNQVHEATNDNISFDERSKLFVASGWTNEMGKPAR